MACKMPSMNWKKRSPRQLWTNCRISWLTMAILISLFRALYNHSGLTELTLGGPSGHVGALGSAAPPWVLCDYFEFYMTNLGSQPPPWAQQGHHGLTKAILSSHPLPELTTTTLCLTTATMASPKKLWTDHDNSWLTTATLCSPRWPHSSQP